MTMFLPSETPSNKPKSRRSRSRGSKSSKRSGNRPSGISAEAASPVCFNRPAHHVHGIYTHAGMSNLIPCMGLAYSAPCKAKPDY